MAFNSFLFWLAFPVVFIMYWILPNSIGRNALNAQVTVRPKNLFLILVSYLFYANWKPAYVLILAGITLITFLGARLLTGKEERKKRMAMFIMAFIVLLPLLVFKYYNFINDSIWSFLSSAGLRFELKGLNWAIPVGISFYTFQALAYLFDVYYNRIRPEKSLLDYTLFVCFFPQIFSGPISKASELLPQIKEERRFDYTQGVQGLKFLLWGLFLKLVLADRLGLYVDKVFDDYEMYSGGTCVLAAFFFSCQIYSDFAGYSLMAVGVAKTLGFNLINNFKRPYFSISITDFWRRWHISLSRWLKDYVYIPMGGNRCSRIRNYWNIFVTFLVSGIWHGANWTYITWGMIHGIVQIIEKALSLNKIESKGFTRVARIVGTFILVTLAWVFFRLPSLGEAVRFIGHSFSAFSSPEVLSLTNFAIYVFAIAILFFKELREEFFPSKLRFMDNYYVRWFSYVVIFSMILLCGALDSGSFIYGSF